MNWQNDKSVMKRLFISAIPQGIAEIKISVDMVVWILNSKKVWVHRGADEWMCISRVILQRCCKTLWKYRNSDLWHQCNLPVNQQRKNELYLYIHNYSLL